MLTGFLSDIAGTFTLWNLAALVLGTAWGIFAGALPGITGSIGVALLLPLTFGMQPEAAIVLLCASYCGSMFGGSISTILMGAPGTASAAATLLDGRELAKQKKAGLGVGVALVASTFGGIIGAIILICFCTPLSRLALLFGPPEYFTLGLFGLTIISSLSKNTVKGFIAGIFGMMLATVGLDRFTGLPRYTFDIPDLLSGIEFLPALIGLFALSEMLQQINEVNDEAPVAFDKVETARLPGLALVKRLWKSISLGGVIGTVIGIMPGAGGNIASWLAYSQAKKYSRTPEEFGKGSLEGIAAPEAANSASEGGSLVPTLALGIPGSNTTAILLGALSLQGLTPGPTLFVEHPEVVFSVYGTVFIANFVVLFLGYLLIRPVCKLSAIPIPYVVTCVCLLVCTAAFAIQNSVFDIKVALVFGLVGLLMKRFGFPVAATVLGMILGPIIEPALQRSLLLSHGSYTIFVTRPLACGILLLTLFSFLSPMVAAAYRNIKMNSGGAR